MVFSLCDDGPAGRIQPWDGAGSEFSTSATKNSVHGSSEDEPPSPVTYAMAHQPRCLAARDRAPGQQGFISAPVPCTVGGVGTSRPTQREVSAATSAAEAVMRPQRVPVNVYETPGALVILAPMPAVTPGDVTIELTPGSLRFWAHLRSAGPRVMLLQEWEYGGYEREVDVPAGFGAGVEAAL